MWFGTDPLASKYPMNSPYVYCNGNPIRYVDPDGRWSIDINLNVSIGVQSSGKVGFAAVEFNLFSVTLIDVNFRYDSEASNHFSFDASVISGPDRKTNMVQEASIGVSLIQVGAVHSFETTGSSFIEGTDKSELILPISINDKDITLRTSYGGSAIVGGEANFSVTF